MKNVSDFFPPLCYYYIKISKVQETYIQWFNQTTHKGGVWRLLTSRLPKGDTYPCNTLILKCLSPILVFSMIKLETTVDIGHILMETAFIGPVGDIMHIQEGILPFIRMEDLLHPN